MVPQEVCSKIINMYWTQAAITTTHKSQLHPLFMQQGLSEFPPYHVHTNISHWLGSAEAYSVHYDCHEADYVQGHHVRCDEAGEGYLRVCVGAVQDVLVHDESPSPLQTKSHCFDNHIKCTKYIKYL